MIGTGLPELPRPRRYGRCALRTLAIALAGAGALSEAQWPASAQTTPTSPAMATAAATATAGGQDGEAEPEIEAKPEGEEAASEVDPGGFPADPADIPDLPPASRATPPPGNSNSTPTPRPDLSALPAASGALDSATVKRIIDRLVALHFLASAANADNPEALDQAIRSFQANIGISASGTLDRDTVGRLTTQ